MNNPIDRRVATALQSYTVLAVIAILIGAAVVPYAASVAEDDEQYVAVVNIDETISSSTSQDTVQELRELRSNESVEAVVLRISSPGGSAASSESMYLAVKRLSAEKPVYTSVDQYAASGAYYTAVPSDRIYVTPASLVGHVGVIGTAPSDGLSASATTGPDKAHRGMTRDQYYASLESMKRAFVGAVMTERGDRLNVSRETVAEASAYQGGRAVQTGYADEVGGLEAAIAGAAEEAGLSEYQVVYTNPADPQGIFLLSGGSGASGNATVAAEGAPYTYQGVDTVHFLMIYGTPENQQVIYNSTAQGGA
ncbi:S49 family peptidase [Haloarcula argentinensis]|uniref:S49 family peptidase n=1 Tax=Haloarcula argentinensis TaxID=43776 RepID=A0A847U7G0_HALAR|nr:S49 family peptidase [Haloarcula argentinensis]NLV14222.1 S49 family peptidase [Haloarcula argentinensis]